MNINLYSRSTLVLFVMILGLSICLPGMNATAETAISSTVTINSSTKTITDSEWYSLSYSANCLIKHIDEARMAIDLKDKEGALAQLDKGMTLVNIIKTVLPTAQVSTDIKAGEYVYHDEDYVNIVLIPVYNEIIRYDILRPVIEAKIKSARMKKVKYSKRVLISLLNF